MASFARAGGGGGTFYIRPHCIKQTGFEYPRWTKPKAKLCQGWAHIWWRTKKLVNSRNLLRQRRHALVLLANAVNSKIKVMFTCFYTFCKCSLHQPHPQMYLSHPPLFFLFFWLREFCLGVTLMGTRTARARRTKAADGCPVPVDYYMFHRRGALRLALGGIQEWEVNDQNTSSYR